MIKLVLSFREKVMALVQQGWEVQISFAGSDAKETTRNHQTSAAVTTDAEAQTAATALIALYNAITDCVVTRYSVVKRYVENALSYPAGNIMVQDRALITVNLSDTPGKTGTLNVPGPSVGLFQGATGPARRKVDLSDSDLVSFLQAFGVSGNFTLSDGEYYSGVQDGKRVTAKDNASNS